MSWGNRPPRSDSRREPIERTEGWKFAQAILGRPVSDEREYRQFLADISTEHADQLRRELAAEAALRADEEFRGWLRDVAPLHEAEWNPAKHPRRGSQPNPGWFAPTGGEGGGDGPSSRETAKLDHSKSEDVWKAAKDVLKYRGLPDAIIDWNHMNKTAIQPSDGPKYSHFWKTIYLPKDVPRRVVRASEDPKLPTGLGMLHNEAFHAWYQQHAKSTWYGRIVRNQSQYTSYRNEKAEEAASEMVHSTIVHMEATGEKPPVFSDARKRGITISPEHNEKGQDWHGHADASLPMSEELYYATLWIMYNGSKDPGVDANGSRLSSLKKWYNQLKSPGKPSNP